jgi:hypothetical protein
MDFFARKSTVALDCLDLSICVDLGDRGPQGVSGSTS